MGDIGDAGGVTIRNTQMGRFAPCPLIANVDGDHTPLGTVLVAMQTDIDTMLVEETDGLQAKRVARATYDFAVNGGAISVIGLGVSLPDNAIVTRAWYEVITTFESAGADAATISISIPTDDVDGIVAAIAISDGTDVWDAGLHEAIQDGTAAAMSVKTTAAREISVEIAVQIVSAGKFILFAEYVVSD